MPEPISPSAPNPDPAERSAFAKWTRAVLWCIAILLTGTTVYFAVGSLRFQRDLNRWASEPSFVAAFTPAELEDTTRMAWEQDCNIVCKQGLYARFIEPTTNTPIPIDSLLGLSGYALFVGAPSDRQLKYWYVSATETTDSDGWIFLASYHPPRNGPVSLDVFDVDGPLERIANASIEFKMIPYLCGIEQMASAFGFVITTVVGISAVSFVVPLWCTRKPKPTVATSVGTRPHA